MIINIDKKYVGHYMINDYRVGDNVSVKIADALIIAIDGDTYTLETSNEERDKFVIEAIEKLCHSNPDATEEIFEALYDAGARFK